jgi:hypothetical protein
MLLPLTILFATACGVDLQGASSASETDGGTSGVLDGDGDGDGDGDSSSGSGSSSSGSGSAGSTSDSTGRSDTGMRADGGSHSTSEGESSDDESSGSHGTESVGTSESDTSESGTSESGTSESGTSESGTSESGTSGSESSESGRSESESSESGDLPQGPARVELGLESEHAAPGSFVILAKTGITNVTGSSIAGGDLGVSPAAATFITGFGLTADPSNEFSTSPSVVAPAKVFASDYAVPTPANLSSAVLGMEAAYTDAAGRIDPDYLNLDSGEIGGLTLSPGLYTWGTSVTIPEDVTLEGGEEDVWIFQISNDLDQSTATQVNLTGGAQARNVFWQVAGQVTIHADAHFEGVILTQTAVTLQTNATFTGRILAQTLVALDDNKVTAPD